MNEQRWLLNPAHGLRSYPNGTRFMLRRDAGLPEAEYELVGNLPGDERWTAQPVGGLSSEICDLRCKKKWQYKLCLPKTPETPTLRGQWRHSNGYIFCGTLRVARADFDTNPSPEFCARVFDDIVRAMNADVVKAFGQHMHP